MIHRLSYHPAPRLPLEYAMDPRKAPQEGPERGRVQIVVSNMTAKSVPELCAEFQVFLDARPYAERPVAHIVLAPHPADLERLVPGVRHALIREYMAHQGYADAPYVAIEHWDTDARHYSIIASRVDASGDLIHSAWEGHAGKMVLYRLEERYDLVRTGPGAPRRSPDRDQLERTKRLKAAGRAEPEVRDEIAARIDAVARPGLVMSDFARELREQGVSLRLRTERDGRISGISYGWHTDGTVHAVAGRSLGAAYTWPGLQRLGGLSYDPVRDPIASLLDPPRVETLPRPEPRASEPEGGVSPGLQELMAQLDELRELERRESLLRLQAQQLEDRHWAYGRLNPDRHELASGLSGLYRDRGAARDALERLFATEEAQYPGEPSRAVAATLERVEAEPESLGAVRTKRTILGERPLSVMDVEFQVQLPAVLTHAREFLERKIDIEAEGRQREERLAQVREDLIGIGRRIRELPSSRLLLQRTAPEMRQLEPYYMRAMELRFPRAMQSIRYALQEGPSLGLGRG